MPMVMRGTRSANKKPGIFAVSFFLLFVGCSDVLGLNLLEVKPVDGNNDGGIATVDGSADASTTIIYISPASPAPLSTPHTLKFTVTELYPDQQISDVTNLVTWQSSDPTVFTVDNTGLVTPTLAGTTASGTANLTASLSVPGSPVLYTAPVSLTVKNSITSVAIITPTSSTAPYIMAPNTTLQFSLQATYGNGTTANLTNGVTWASSATSNMTIDPSSGLASSATGGTTQVSATYQSGSTTLTATPVTVNVKYKTYTATFTFPAAVSNGNENVGTYTVPADFTTAVSMAVAIVATETPTGNATVDFYLLDASNNQYFSMPSSTARATFNLNNTFTPSAFPASFIAGAQYTVIEGIAYTGWTLQGYTGTYTLTYY